MNKSLLALSFISVSSFSVLGQDSFTSIINAGYSSSDNNVYNINGSYFLSPVDNTVGPLEEAVFLNRANALRAGYRRSEFDLQDDSFSSITSSSWNLGATYFLNNPDFFINIDIAHFSNFTGPSSEGYTLGAGYYLSNDWAVTIDARYDEDFENGTLTVATKKLIDLGDDSFLSLNASATTGNINYVVGADYYFNKRFSFGLAHSWFDDFDADTTSINANWFITDAFSVNAKITKLDNGFSSINTFSLGISARF